MNIKNFLEPFNPLEQGLRLKSLTMMDMYFCENCSNMVSDKR